MIVDEFGELLANRPEFIDLFLAIGRVGRSLGMHLLLSSQRLEEGRLRGLEGHLRYRICLRTYSAQESKSVLGTPDAFLLPPYPGVGYLSVDTDIYQRFKTALVTTPHDDGDARRKLSLIGEFELGAGAARGRARGGARRARAPTSTCSSAGIRAEYGRRDQRPSGVAAAAARPPGAVDRARGRRAGGSGRRTPPVATRAVCARASACSTAPPSSARIRSCSTSPGSAATSPSSARRRPARARCCGRCSPRCCVTYEPDELRAYALDFGGGLLRALDRAPHLGGVCGKVDPERVRATVRQIRALIAEREERFRELGIDSMTDARARGRSGLLEPDDAADVLLVIDNWGGLLRDYEELTDDLSEIAAAGLQHGVHLVVTAGRWAELRPAIREAFGTRLELRLNDPMESDFGRRIAETVPVGAPGAASPPTACTSRSRCPGSTAGPRRPGWATRSPSWPSACTAAGTASRPRPVRVLPERIALDELAPSPGAGLALGVEELTLAPATVDLEAGDQHLLVLGEPGSGRSSVLRLGRALTRPPSRPVERRPARRDRLPPRARRPRPAPAAGAGSSPARRSSTRCSPSCAS